MVRGQRCEVEQGSRQRIIGARPRTVEIADRLELRVAFVLHPIVEQELERRRQLVEQRLASFYALSRHRRFCRESECRVFLLNRRHQCEQVIGHRRIEAPCSAREAWMTCTTWTTWTIAAGFPPATGERCKVGGFTEQYMQWNIEGEAALGGDAPELGLKFGSQFGHGA